MNAPAICKIQARFRTGQPLERIIGAMIITILRLEYWSSLLIRTL